MVKTKIASLDYLANLAPTCYCSYMHDQTKHTLYFLKKFNKVMGGDTRVVVGPIDTLL